MAKANATSIFTEDSPMLHRALLQQSSNPLGTTRLGKKREAVLLIRGLVERIELEEKMKYKLGRFNAQGSSRNEINLSPYGAEDRGVSRVHAQLHLEGNSLYITDLGSTNGTFIGGERIPANVAQQLHKGEEVLLGRLPIQILFS